MTSFSRFLYVFSISCWNAKRDHEPHITDTQTGRVRVSTRRRASIIALGLVLFYIVYSFIIELLHHMHYGPFHPVLCSFVLLQFT
jgi:hypothetical protein